MPLISRDGKPKRNRVFALGALCLVILGAAAAFYWYRATEPGPAKGPRAAARAGVPVTVAAASRQDVPIYLTGIGTVQAYFTVDIHAKVDGELQEVLFTEGQRVKKGDVLAKIDPRLYQAALDQAKAKRAQDAATSCWSISPSPLSATITWPQSTRSGKRASCVSARS